MREFNYIWTRNDNTEKDSYADFKTEFSFDGEKTYLLLTCDSNFEASVNGVKVAFGECADYPDYKLYYKTDITKYCNAGKNLLEITVWYYGEDSQTYIKADRGLGFIIETDKKVIATSGKDTLSRKNINYKNGYKKLLTLQLGYSYYYDNTINDTTEFLGSEVVGKICAEQRPLEAPVLTGNVPMTVTKIDGGYLVDLLRETVGYLALDLVSPTEQLLTISYGEHLKDGKPVRFMGIRDFSVEFKCKKGENRFTNLMRRLAGRYIFVQTENPIEINYIGLNQTEYVVKEKTVDIKDEFLKKIYDISVYTLRCCMHYHYEDCPWREQAFYTLDSRNQMLCGYYAFETFEFARENILLATKGLRKDGLLSLNFPGGTDIPIPFFSLAYPLQVYEYAKHTGDRSVIDKTKDVILTVMKTFSEKVDETGLIPVFPYPYWNFYEWSDGSDRMEQIDRPADSPYVKSYDLILNCMYVYVTKIVDKFLGIQTDVSKTLTAIKDTFYDKEKGIYKLSTDGELYGQLGNALALLIGLGGKDLADKLVKAENMVKITLSMNCFLYDALLSFGDEYKQFIKDDMLKKYKMMLDAGATTFWETEKGSEDFDGAGSLCHGWSAMPIYYMNILGMI